MLFENRFADCTRNGYTLGYCNIILFVAEDLPFSRISEIFERLYPLHKEVWVAVRTHSGYTHWLKRGLWVAWMLKVVELVILNHQFSLRPKILCVPGNNFSKSLRDTS